MNKMIALILSFVLFVLPVCAESIDVSSLSDDELSILYLSILDEMNTRSIEMSGEIFPGQYIVGIDILPGKYSITYYENDSSIERVAISIYENQTGYEKKEGIFRDLWDSEEYFLDLKEGMIFRLDNASVSIRSIPTPFWAVKK